MPQPLPVVLLGRLAIDRTYQGSGLGRALLQHALRESIKTSQTIGAVAVMVDAISESAKAFYQRSGFVVSPTHDMTLLVPMKEIIALYVDGPS
jgi:predicted N-acetyltransferase YhbS